MAIMSFGNLTSVQTTTFDLFFVFSEVLTTATATDLDWAAAGKSFTMTGTGLQPVASGGVLTDLTGGTLTGLDANFSSFVTAHITGWHVSAASWFDLFIAQDWHGMLTLVMSGNDQMNGTPGDDILTGLAGGDTIFGNGGADTIAGGVGNDRLIGGTGDDQLTGGLGADSFVFGGRLLASGNTDHITDFHHAQDHILLSHLTFHLGLGPLHAASFSNGAATTAAQHILYDAATGTVSYDADGNGSAKALPFAQVGAGHTLTAADFTVF